MKTVLSLLPLFLSAHTALALNPHPRIWLDSTMLSELAAKVSAPDADWLAVKATADAVLSYPTTRMTITSATNGNPVRFTVTETLPMLNGGQLYIGGGTGSWAAVNILTGNSWTATVTGAHTFTIPVDSTAFGSFSGQTLEIG